MSEDTRYLNDLLSIHRQRFQMLERKAATYGIDCPTHITIEKEEIRKEMARIEESISNTAADTLRTNPAINLERVIERETRMQQIENAREVNRIQLLLNAIYDIEIVRIKAIIKLLRDSDIEFSVEALSNIIQKIFESRSQINISIDTDAMRIDQQKRD